jgi:Reverse transcriptase (RNA-dependent DNA polymerase)
MNGLIVQWPETAEERDTLIQALVASESDPDVLTYDQAVRDIDVESWREAMNKEIMSLVTQGTWEVVPRSQATAVGQKIIPGTWVLHRKRKPDGSISKLKARWCVRGDLQDSQDNTFAPVVRWETIRMLLYFSLFFGLKTKSIDFSNAFVQATLKDPISTIQSMSIYCVAFGMKVATTFAASSRRVSMESPKHHASGSNTFVTSLLLVASAKAAMTLVCSTRRKSIWSSMLMM